MNATSSPSRNTPLNATVNAYQSWRGRSPFARSARDLGLVDRVLVVQRLQPARAQDRLAQPLQTEDQQHRADDEPQRVDRKIRQRRAEAATITAKADERRGDAPPGRSPAPRDADREHDRECLDHLDRGRQERGDDQQNAVHDSSTAPSRLSSVRYRYGKSRSKCYDETFADGSRERGDELAPAERRVAELLLDLGPEATLLSAAALAEQLGTSDATVVRTAKALGYSGLAELRRALAAYGDNPPLGERLRRTLEQTPGDELFASAIRNHLSALETLTRNVSPEAFQEAVDDPRRQRPSGLARRRTVGTPRRVRAAADATDRQAQHAPRAHRHVVRRRAPHARARRRGRRVRLRPPPVTRSRAPRARRNARGARRAHHRHARTQARSGRAHDAPMRSRCARSLRQPRHDARRHRSARPRASPPPTKPTPKPASRRSTSSEPRSPADASTSTRRDTASP